MGLSADILEEAYCGCRKLSHWSVLVPSFGREVGCRLALHFVGRFGASSCFDRPLSRANYFLERLQFSQVGSQPRNSLG